MDFVIRRQSEKIESSYCDPADQPDKNFDYRNWEWLHLRTECKNLNLEPFYDTYVQRLHRSYLSIFLAIHSIIGIVQIVVLVLTREGHINLSSPEVYCYLSSVLLVWFGMTTSLFEDVVQKHQRLPLLMSCITIIGLVLIDITVPVYNSFSGNSEPPLRPAYETYILLVIYIFLPIAKNSHCILLGAFTTVSYLIEMWLITYANDTERMIRTATECFFLVCINCFGLFFRLINEVAIRRAFLDRRECVEGNVLLKFARDQKKNLLLSILPAHIASEIELDIRRMIQEIRSEKRKPTHLTPNGCSLDAMQQVPRSFRGHAISKLYVEHHSDVSVLYADVVNYTFMTTQLPVKVLVETLHELFVKFDQASEENNVLRIKFLGDCYYCVAGVPEKNPQHAKSCVDLGLRMIRDIREVRVAKNLNIDMRIGVHSGSIMSGVIGACKWQYDIWSQDATIANRMESTGLPGKVHITKQTLDLLDNQYIYENGTLTARNDLLFQRNGIVTYLISPQYLTESNFHSPEDLMGRRYSLGVKKMIARSSKMSRAKIQNESITTVRRNFMQNSMEQYLEVLNETNTEMACELDQMPIGKFHFNNVINRISRGSRSSQEMAITEKDARESSGSNNVVSTVMLCFNDRTWEWAYMSEPDLMLKYSTLMGFVMFVAILLMQLLNGAGVVLCWIVHGTSAAVFLVILPITWFNKLWILCRSLDAEEPDGVRQPTNRIVKWIFLISRKIIRNALARVGIYLTTVMILTLNSMIHFVDCTQSSLPEETPCIHPWVITQCMVLTICVNFMFNRIHFALKLTVCLFILGLYTWIVYVKFELLFDNSSSFNASLDSNNAHTMFMVFISIIFHMIDRQTEYISRVDFNWKRQLLKKQIEAEFTKDTIKVLIQNILPAHVAEIYLSRQIKNELYYEEYDNVAIMFATITNFDGPCEIDQIDWEKNILSILNRIICDFDEALISHVGAVKIEKIKVAGWTYMVACGLDPGRADSTSSILNSRGVQRSSQISNGRRSWNTTKFSSKPKISINCEKYPNENKPISRKNRNATYVLTKFALQLMRVLHSFNEENFMSEGRLRIGISHGKVMAGVVGSSKPLYDVWGNAVNMAARMDSTGLPGRIQVTEETAGELQEFGIECNYRGETFVKGRGSIPTYFVGVDDQCLEFVRCKIEENTAL